MEVNTQNGRSHRPLVVKEWNSAEELWLFVCGERAIFTELATLKGC
jgi:hypothetical protein